MDGCGRTLTDGQKVADGCAERPNKIIGAPTALKKKIGTLQQLQDLIRVVRQNWRDLRTQLYTNVQAGLQGAAAFFRNEIGRKKTADFVAGFFRMNFLDIPEVNRQPVFTSFFHYFLNLTILGF